MTEAAAFKYPLHSSASIGSDTADKRPLVDLPNGWHFRRIKFTSRLRYGLGQPPLEKVGGRPFIRATNIDSGTISTANMVYVDPASVPPSRNAFLSAGDIIIVRSGALTGDSAIVPTEFDGAVAGFDIVISAQNVSQRFLAWTLLTPFVRAQLDLLKTRAAQPHLNVEDVGSVTICVPPHEEQFAIADILDRETAEADALVAKYERLIELLEERRVALITRAVTKGLDSNVPMKDSGYSWIPTVPGHWSVEPLKHLTSIPITDGPHETPDFVSDGIPFVSAEAVSAGHIDLSKARGYISSNDHSRYSRKYSPVRGDIFIIKSGATTGVSAIVETDTVFDIWSPLAAVRCGPKVLAPFLLQVIRSRVFQDSIALHWNYGTQQNIGMSVLENLSVPLPPVSEQRGLLEYMSKQIADIVATQSRVRAAIKLTSEHRSALIAAAVTGQFDVTTYRSKKQPALEILA